MLKIAFFSKVASRNCVLHDATAVTFANVTSLGLCQIEGTSNFPGIGAVAVKDGGNSCTAEADLGDQVKADHGGDGVTGEAPVGALRDSLPQPPGRFGRNAPLR